MRAAHAIKGIRNNNQLDAVAMDCEGELRIITELSRGEEESKILWQPGREGGEFREGGDGVHDGEVQGRRPKQRGGGDHGGNGRAQMTNATINYVLNT